MILEAAHPKSLFVEDERNKGSMEVVKKDPVDVCSKLFVIEV